MIDIELSNGKILDIERMVLLVRKWLSTKYDVVNSESKYYNYMGLCDIASDILEGWIHEDCPDVMVELVHGEQRHRLSTPYANWFYQHTWVKIYEPNNPLVCYVDITSQQFQDVYDDIPDYYISLQPPKWYYPDRENPAFDNINDKILIPFIIDKKFVKIGIVEFCQYEIWGGFVRLYQKIKKIK